MSWGGDLRVRNEYFNNAQSLGSDGTSPFAPYHSQDYFRFRGRLWTSLLPVEGMSINARLAAEPREWMEPSSAGNYFGQSGMEWRYGIVDNLNVQIKKAFDLPLNITVGRQDLFLGDGFLVADGTPGDGSWTYFLDAARLTYEIKDCKTTIDAIGIIQSARPDAWFPTAGPSTDNTPAYFLTDQDEKGAILWVANKSIPQANVDAYFMYKSDSRLTEAPIAPTGDNADIYTLGARVSGTMGDHWKYSAEGAYQFGEKQDPRINNALLDPDARTAGFRDIGAFGLNTKAAYLFKDKLNNVASFSFEYLSGDDPSTEGDEMFDLLWGRWPRWSELYNIYSYIPEHRVGQTANVYRFGPGWNLTPIKNMDLIFNYNLLFADQDIPTRAGAAFASSFSQDGNFRGHYLQAVLKYKFSQHLNGHLWAETIWPGDFYATRQMMTFLRAEVMMTF
jgi:hypothetical protein